MIKDVTIRKAVMADINEIQQVAIDTWHDTYEGLIPRDIQDLFLSKAYSHEMMATRLQCTLLLVAVEGGRVIGFANFQQKESDANLTAIYIDPKHQGKKVGSKLLQAGLDQLKDISKLYVEVERDNAIGEAFYKAKGFTLIGEYDEDFYGHMLQTKKLVLQYIWS